MNLGSTLSLALGCLASFAHDPDSILVQFVSAT